MNPPIHRQLRHKPITRLLTALHWLDAATQPLTSTPIETTPTTTTKTPEGHHTQWARKAQRKYHYRINQLAETIENELDPTNTTTTKPQRTRCKGCGRWQQTTWNHCPHCGHQHKTTSTTQPNNSPPPSEPS